MSAKYLGETTNGGSGEEEAMGKENSGSAVVGLRKRVTRQLKYVPTKTFSD